MTATTADLKELARILRGQGPGVVYALSSAAAVAMLVTAPTDATPDPFGDPPPAPAPVIAIPTEEDLARIARAEAKRARKAAARLRGAP